MKKIKVALIGAGQRGMDSYGVFALTHPNELEFIAVAEPSDSKRDEFSKLHSIPKEMQFKCWKDLLSKNKLCEALIISTQDQMHYAPTMKALDIGYNILLEKPMTHSLTECIEMTKKAEENNCLLMICHVLRYTPFFSKLKEILDSGVIGDIVCVQHNENVSYFHQAHSFVRGNWRNTAESSPMILAKSCHDMDILNWLLGKKCINLSSFGSLKLFKKENAPKDCAKRCTDGCIVSDECPYNALAYLDKRKYRDRFLKIVSEDTSEESVIEALKKGPYGRCVYYCDNDVVDHQVVNMQFEDDISVSFVMSAFTHNLGRTIKIMGTKGEICGVMESGQIKIWDFLSGNTQLIQVNDDGSKHNGGDSGLIKAFIKQISRENPSESLTSAKISLASHAMALAAEEARKTNTIVNIDNFVKKYS